MKKSKIILSGLLLTVSLFISGCTQKEAKLVCNQNASGVDIEFNIGFKGNIVKTMDFNYDMDLSSYSDAQIESVGKQDFCTIVKNSMSDFKESFTDCKQNISNKHLKVNSVLDVNKVSKNFLDKMGTPEGTKEALEKQGYTCTIK